MVLIKEMSKADFIKNYQERYIGTIIEEFCNRGERLNLVMWDLPVGERLAAFSERHKMGIYNRVGGSLLRENNIRESVRNSG